MEDYSLISNESQDEILKAAIAKIVAEQKDIDPEIAQIVNDNFWDIL